jgi:ATP-dependent DNA ligase
LPAWIAEHLRAKSAVLDGEICCVDEGGRPNFRDLLFRKRKFLGGHIRPISNGVHLHKTRKP